MEHDKPAKRLEIRITDESKPKLVAVVDPIRIKGFKPLTDKEIDALTSREEHIGFREAGYRKTSDTSVDGSLHEETTERVLVYDFTGEATVID